MASSLTTCVLQTLNSHAPVIVKRKRSRRPCPWLTEELVAAVRLRNSLHRQLMKARHNDVLRDQHRAARATARKLDRKLQNAYFLSQCTTSNQRKLWHVMNTVTGRGREYQAPKASLQDLSTVFGDVVTDTARHLIWQHHKGPPLRPVSQNSSLWQFWRLRSASRLWTHAKLQAATYCLESC